MKGVFLAGMVLSAFHLLAGCSEKSKPAGADSGNDSPPGQLDVSVCAPGAGPHSVNIDNRYLPLPAGYKLVLQGQEGSASMQLELTVLEKTEQVAGVNCRVLEERESKDGSLVEVSRNFFVQAPDGTVCYYGEEVDIYRDGVVVGHEGAWRAGQADNRPGIMMPASPQVGMKYANEVAPGIAEDQAEIVSLGGSIDLPAGHFEGVLEVRETSPLDAGSSRKVYAPGIGLVVDDNFRLVRQGG